MHAIYLDYAAATPLRSEVLDAMRPFFQERFYNPSALYLSAQSVKKSLDEARQTVAKSLGTHPSEIVFTAGGTEANNLAIHGVMSRFPGAHMVSTTIEHDSVLSPAAKYQTTQVDVQADGRVDLSALHKAINDQTVLVSVGWVNNEIGTIQPLSKIAALVGGIRDERDKNGIKTPLYLHTDACQAGNYLSLQVNKLGVDMMTLNGGKIYGPKQSGVLYVKAGVSLTPLILGGGQERGARSGTENVAGIVGFAAALRLAQNERSERTERMRDLRTHFIEKVEEKLPKASVNGSRKHRVANNVHLTFPGTDNERLMMQLDERGIMCAVGSACSASKDEPSHVLRAIGLSEEDARSSLRFSMGASTQKGDIDRLINLLTELV